MLLQENGDMVKLELSGRVLVRCVTGAHQVENGQIAVTFHAMSFGLRGEDKHCCLPCLIKYSLERYIQPLLIQQWKKEAEQGMKS